MMESGRPRKLRPPLLSSGGSLSRHIRAVSSANFHDQRDRTLRSLFARTCVGWLRRRRELDSALRKLGNNGLGIRVARLGQLGHTSRQRCQSLPYCSRLLDSIGLPFSRSYQSLMIKKGSERLPSEPNDKAHQGNKQRKENLTARHFLNIRHNAHFAEDVETTGSEALGGGGGS
jgi:hypothetical protein